MIVRIVQACVILVCLTANAAAQIIDRSPTPPCTKTWTSITFYERLDAMPQEIVAAFAALMGENKNPRNLNTWIVERNRRWGATDVRSPDVPNLRFIYGLQSRDRWFIWYEYGGIARGAQVVAFDSSEPSTEKVTFIARLYAQTEDLCTVTSSLMHARIRPGGGLDNR